MRFRDGIGGIAFHLFYNYKNIENFFAAVVKEGKVRSGAGDFNFLDNFLSGV